MNADIQEWTDADTGAVNSFPAGKPNIFRQGQIVYAQEACAGRSWVLPMPQSNGACSYYRGIGREGGREGRMGGKEG